MRCPYCKNRLLQKSGTRTRLRSKGPIVFDESGKCKAHCYWCGKEVEIPLEISDDIHLEAERFILPSKT